MDLGHMDKFMEDRKEIVTDSGLRMLVTREGKGKKPKKGETVEVHYSGMLEDGTIFDSSLERKSTFKFEVGMGRVIKGWDEALLDMKKGSVRTLIIPPELAYGDRATGKIPPNSILIFDVYYLDDEMKKQLESLMKGLSNEK